MISVHFQGKPYNITVIQVYDLTRNAQVKQFYDDLQALLELTPQKDFLFILGDWNAKVVSQETPGVTGQFGLGVQNEAGQRLTEFCQKNALVIANTLFQQYKRRLYTWTSPDGQYRNQIDYILCSQRWRSSIQAAKTRPGVDCGSDINSLLFSNESPNQEHLLSINLDIFPHFIFAFLLFPIRMLPRIPFNIRIEVGYKHPYAFHFSSAIFYILKNSGGICFSYLSVHHLSAFLSPVFTKAIY